jgi:sialic acid synthase SpsE
VNTRSVPYLKERYGLTTGYSNHAVEPEAVLAAVALGAQFVEVHVTDRKSGREFRDHAMSFEPAELAELVKSVGKVRASLGTFGKSPQSSEEPVRKAIRKGIVAARDLRAGDTLGEGDLMFARPALEFSASEHADLIGRILKVPLKRGEVVPRNGVEPR